MIENRTSGYLCNKLFSESNEEKCMAFQRVAWSLIAHKSPIKNCLTALQAFPSDLSLCILYVLFHKGKDTSVVSQPSVQHLLYEHLVHLVCSHKCFNNFHLSKNILINKFFHWNMYFYLFTIHDARELSVSLWSKILSCD